ncbi:MAG TPA: PQQ-binding-like beta-propeller repeat protein [Pyrinomonadaceae bacterium]
MSLRRSLILYSILLIILFAFAPLSFAQPRTQTTTSPLTSLHLRWPQQQGVLRYRLQLARDEQFKDIVFDRAVYGNEYVVADLGPGRYFWRVAPAVKETGTFTPPRLVEISGQTKADAVEDMRTTTSTPTTLPSGDPGWRTTTGSISRPLVARLRSATSYDLVGVNADGMAYGIDGTNGMALWAARFRPAAKQGEPTGSGGGPTFTPVLIEGRNGLTNVVVAFEGGVRALEGATGRELWRARLESRPTSGAVATAENDGAKRLLITFDKSTSLTVLNAENGQTVGEAKLDAPVIAPPSSFPLDQGSGVVFAVEGGQLDVRNSNGERVRSIKMDTTITTPALAVKGPRGALVLVGTESGLISLTASDLKPIGRIATEGDAPVGMLSAIDLENDGAPEVLMITRSGRLALINTTDGKIKWHTSGEADASSAAFADLNGDGVLDVLVAAGQDFARGFSGRDGSLIWRAEEDVKAGTQASASTQTRALVAAPLGDGPKVYVVGTDVARTGLRAVGLPKDSVKAAKE